MRGSTHRTHVERQNHRSAVSRGWKSGVEVDDKGHRRLGRTMELVCILIVEISQYRAVNAKKASCAVCKLHLKRVYLKNMCFWDSLFFSVCQEYWEEGSRWPHLG